MSNELIFLLHPDDATLDRLSSALHEGGFKVLTARHEAGALEYMTRNRFVAPDALVMPLSDDGPLLEKLRQNPLTADLPVVVLAERPAEDRLRALRQGLPDLVPAPFDAEELLLALRLSLQRSTERRRDSRVLRGSLDLLPVVDLLQTLEAGRRSGAVELRSGARKATLWLRNGQPIDAEVDDGRRGEEAVMALVQFAEGSFEVVFGDVSLPQRISASLTGLLLEGLRLADEAKRDETVPHAALPDPPPRPAREVLIAHRALTLLNVASAYASGLVEPALLVSALEQSRSTLLAELPELSAFEIGASGQISLLADRNDIDSQRLALAAAGWTRRVFLRLERALPGRFGPSRLLALTEAVRDDMESLGFDEALGLERKARTPHEEDQ